MAKKPGAKLFVSKAVSADAKEGVGKKPPLPNCAPGKITTITLPRGTSLHRVHQEAYSGDAFNPYPYSNARFSTICDSKNTVIPTIYLASTFEGALMETIFHEIPYQQNDKFLDRAKIEGHHHSVVVTNQEVLLADLTTKSLRKLGVPPERVVTSEKSEYSYSRAIAEEIYNHNPSVQGLRWMSRQDNTAVAYILFEPRFSSSPLDIHGPSRRLDANAYDEVLELAELLDVQIVPGKV